MAPVKHNGSLLIFTRYKGYVEMRYEEPHSGLPVQKATARPVVCGSNRNTLDCALD